jgi:FdhD protein
VDSVGFAKLAVHRDGLPSTDSVVVEEPLEIIVNGRNLSITMRTPGNDAELVAGFLFTEGLIRSAASIQSINGEGNQVRVELDEAPNVAPRLVMTSACGVCGKDSIASLYISGCTPIPDGSFVIDAETLRRLPAILREAQSVFRETGGIHGAGLFDAQGKLELAREDVGRHNAVDKIVGAVLLERAGRPPISDRLLLLSGRAGFELIQKAAMAGIPMVAAVGAPSTLAVETAQRFNMTLIGFLREDRFNVYAGAERLLPAATEHFVQSHD